MQNINAIINNHIMNILHQNNERREKLQKLEVLSFRWEMFFAKCSLPGKNNLNLTQYKDKVYFGVEKKSFKDSTTAPNPLPTLGN